MGTVGSHDQPLHFIIQFIYSVNLIKLARCRAAMGSEKSSFIGKYLVLIDRSAIRQLTDGTPVHVIH